MADPSQNIDSNNRNISQADMPPPPYSETDIYSVSSQPPLSPRPAPSAAGSGLGSGHGPTAPRDDVASTMSSTSTTGSVIFTPPDTPRVESESINKTTEWREARNASAARYLETRSAPALLPRPPQAPHVITIRRGSVPDDFPYPENWASHDVTRQDWATFVNFLLPDHDSVKNEAIFGEKTKSEDGLDAKSTCVDSERQDIKPDNWYGRFSDAMCVTLQWNDAFFRPRGLVVIIDVDGPGQIPGGRETAFNDPPEEIPQVGPSYQRETLPQRGPGGFQGGWGGFRMDDNGIRFGNNFVADSNGLRIGGLVMDSRGIRMGGQGPELPYRPGFGRAYPSTPPNHPFAQGMIPPPPSFPFEARNHPPQPPGLGFRAPNPYAYSPGHPPPPGHPGANPDPTRGRAPLPDHHGARPRSSSTSSSSSSSSDSSSSTGSIGSLPDHDDIKDEQLPFYIARLELWTANPHETRSKADVKQLKAELKASRNNANPLGPNIDRKALKKQSKTLAQQFKNLKRQQKKERKQRRKAEKKEKKQRKKEMKAARKQHRQEQRGRGRGRTDPPLGPGVPPFQAAYPPMPPMHVPPVMNSAGTFPPNIGGWKSG